jgi:uncharacterized protein (TIGR02996 family)
LFVNAAEHSLPPPTTDRQLELDLREHLYVEGSIHYSPHLLQVRTDDDELEMAYYFFDDHYLDKHRKRAAFLLHEGWQLPGGAREGRYRPAEKAAEFKPAGTGKGSTWLVHLAYYDSGNLDLDGGLRLKGVRVPDLARHLLCATPVSDWSFRGGWEFEPRLLRAALGSIGESLPAIEQEFLREIIDNPTDDVPWNAYSDWLIDNGKRSAGLTLLERGLNLVGRCPIVRMGGGDWADRLVGSPADAAEELHAWSNQLDKGRQPPASILVHVDEHLAQACLPTGKFGNDHLYHQWIYFDDLWASAHTDLANAILRFAKRWDVLSPE